MRVPILLQFFTWFVSAALLAGATNLAEMLADGAVVAPVDGRRPHAVHPQFDRSEPTLQDIQYYLPVSQSSPSPGLIDQERPTVNHALISDVLPQASPPTFACRGKAIIVTAAGRHILLRKLRI